MPLKTTQSTVKNLEETSILKSNVKGKNKYFKLNMDNIQTKLYLLQSEIYKTILFLNKYPLFKTFLKGNKTNNSIIVFGSFAKFTAGKDSDADLLILPNNEEALPFHLLPYKIHKITLSESAFKKSLENGEALIKEIEENHVILNNHSFYVNTLWSYYARQ